MYIENTPNFDQLLMFDVKKITMYIKSKILSFLRCIFNNYSFTMRYGLSKGLKLKGFMGLYYSLIPKKFYKEDLFFLNFNFENMTIFDIGGHDGTLTLFFAKSVGPNGKIYAFEPNPFNYEYLLQNLQLNNSMNVEPFQLAIGASSYNAKFVFRNDGTFGTGTLDKEIQQQIINEQNYSIVEVKVESIDNLFNNKKLSKPDFVKIDVEGLEFDILQGMQMTLKEYKPNLFIEIHGANINDKMKNANEIISFLTGFNYSFYHIETQQIVSIKTTDLPIQGHLFCK